MLTLPVEPRPQTGLMDSLPAVVPSFVSYGSRRSPRKNHVTERRAAQKPYGKPSSPTRRRRLSPLTEAQTEPSVPSRLERTHASEEAPLQEQLNFSFAPETVQEKLQRPPISPRVSSLNQTTVDCSAVMPSNPLETCSLLNPAAAAKGWVIGPLFQSFKSKMASFTEIVMSPVKLFKSNSTESKAPPNDPSVTENTSESLYTSAEEGTHATDLEKSAPKPAVSFDEAEKSDVLKDAGDVMPWRTPETELETIVTQSASNTATSNTTTASAAVSTTTSSESVANEGAASWSARTRTRQNKATPKAAEVCDDFGVENMDSNAVLTKMDSKIGRESDCIFKDRINETQADRTPTSCAILDDLGLQKVKRTLNLSGENGKRKIIIAEIEEEEVAVRVDAPQKRKPKRREETPKPVTKAVTRANKKCKVEQEVILTVNKESNLAVTLEEFKSRDDQKIAKAKVKTVKRAKADSSLDLQTSVGVKMETTLETKQTENVSIASKKRKTRDELKAGSTSAAVSCLSEKAERTLKKTKNGQLKKGKSAAEKVYFEITPSLCENGDAQEDLSAAAQSLQSDAGASKRRTRRTDVQRRKCRVFRGKAKGDAGSALLSEDDADMFKRGRSTRLLRSQSCPEIPALRPPESPWTPHFHSPPRSRSQPPQQPHAAPLSLPSSSTAQHFHRLPRRARRHTVCSLEVEREIAPLCLRKEVYPARRSSSPYDPQHLPPIRALSPGASLSALASGFLCSPLAFLSKRSEGGAAKSSPLCALSPSSSSTLHILSPASSALHVLSPASSTLRSLSPASSTLRSLSPASSTLRSLSPASSTLHILSPASSALHVLSPASSTLRSLSPASSTLRSLSPASSTLRSLSPASSTLRSLSPASSTLRSLSPASSTLRSLSPASTASCSAPSLSSLLGTSLGQLPGFHLRTDTLLSASSDSSVSAVSLIVCPEPEASPEDDEDTSSSSPESEELREEAAHSDSEIKSVKKAEGQRKVSSIKIRKALPKPQNNLTPMGLPKAVRVKKKEFSLEEIYTNKNFSKPPESRLETIFEAPLSRKNGAEAWCGLKRLKRFLEFPELGEARRPKKPLVGAAKANGATSRKRRGGARDEPGLGCDVDSVLCAKLEQLESWLALDRS